MSSHRPGSVAPAQERGAGPSQDESRPSTCPGGGRRSGGRERLWDTGCRRVEEEPSSSWRREGVHSEDPGDLVNTS